jgi:hypothetical protein
VGLNGAYQGVLKLNPNHFKNYAKLPSEIACENNELSK